MNGRHFFRCADCLLVFAIDGTARPERCDCGSPRLQWLGRVEADRVIATVDRCPCDSRCTHARGPQCSCSCGGQNHGTGCVVRVRTDNGAAVIPAQPDLAVRLAAVAAVKAAAEAARDRLNAAGVLDRMARGEFIADRKTWDRARLGLAAIRKATALQSTLAARIKKLDAIGAADRANDQPAGFVADLFGKVAA